MAKYKAGDRVVVRDDLRPNISYRMEDSLISDGVVGIMFKFAGKTVTIDKYSELFHKYRIFECCYNWTDEMFLGLESDVHGMPADFEMEDYI